MQKTARESTRLESLERALGYRYKIIKKIASGGFGEVFLGEHAQLGRKVAIKILLSNLAEQKDVVLRFQREARAAANLSHPNIIDIYDVGEGEYDGQGVHYFVMKYVEGETLAQKMFRDRRVSTPEAIFIIKQIASALAYAHEQNVIHRDIKPANVMLDEYGKPILMDFGVARVQYEGNLTKTGTLMGTPHYLAPEQPLGKIVDGRSDIYSLGIMFYEMLAGGPPFHDINSVTLIFKHINEAPTPLKELIPELPQDVCDVVHKMIEKQSENRYQSAAELVEVLEHLSELYPMRTTMVPKKSTPSTIRNTEKLFVLAREHVHQRKYDKAVEIYATIARREPSNEQVKKELDEAITGFMGRLPQEITRTEITKIKDILSHLTEVAKDEHYVQSLKSLLASEEKKYDATSISERRPPSGPNPLSEVFTIAPNEDSKELLQQTQERILSEVNSLCEQLNFSGALQMLELARVSSPEIAESKTAIVEKNQALYKKFLLATELLQQKKFQEAAAAYRDFLSTSPPYDFQVFDRFRQEAEASLKKVEESVEAPVAAPVSTPAAAQGKPRKFPLIYAVGAVAAVLLIAGYFIAKAKMAPDINPDIPLIEPIVMTTKPAAPVAGPPPVSGKMTITTEPAGATVLMNDQDKGVTPLQLTDLLFGKHLIKVQLKGYKPIEQEVELDPTNAEVEIAMNLEAEKPVVGTMMIESVPPDAEIYIGKKLVGFTPRSFPNTVARKYTITLKKPGFNDFTGTVVVKENETATLTANLTEMPKPVDVSQLQAPKEPEIKPGTLVEMGPDVVPPKAIKRTSVRYPEAAKRAKLQGTVSLSILVSETGKVLDVKLVKSANKILDEATIAVVKEWVYEPAKKKGVPVKIWIPFSVTFGSK